MMLYFLILAVSLSAALIELMLVQNTEISVVISYGLAVPLASAIPRIISKKEILPLRWIEFLILLIVAINAPGSLYFHADAGQYQYDRFIHFATAFLTVPIGFELVKIIFKTAHWKNARLLAYTVALLAVGLFAWEGFQFLIDSTFGTKMFFDYAQSIMRDLWEDILFGVAGIIAGILYIIRRTIAKRQTSAQT